MKTQQEKICDIKALEAGLKQALIIGKKLYIARKKLPKSKTWKNWVETNYDFSVRTAYYYMKVYKNHNKLVEMPPNASIRKLLRSTDKSLCFLEGEQLK